MALDELLASYPAHVQDLCSGARKFLRRCLPEAQESADESARMLSYRLGPGYKGMVCTLLLSKTGIKLGIVGGARLTGSQGAAARGGQGPQARADSDS